VLEQMPERRQLEQSIADLEAQRAALGDAVVDAALAPLQEALAQLEGDEPAAMPESSAERRVVTVLFCDVTGSTALAEQMDPEAWTGIMNTVFELLSEPVARYGGIVARLMGDAILAIFGAPVAHEDDPERAVLAGLAILESIGPYREKLREERDLVFNVRVGINTGLAVVGEVGSDVRGEYTAMGDAVNVAARMEQTAVPGTLQISEETYRRIAALFEVESLGGIEVKGKRRPVPAYRVIGQKANGGGRRGLEERGLSSPLVGREVELLAVQERIERLLDDGEGGIVLIFGEAGLGKSRLKDEARRSAGDGPLWLEGRTLSFGQTLSYWPFQEILRGFARILEEDDEAAAWTKLERSILNLHGRDSGDVLPYLASLLALEVQAPYEEKVAYLDAEALVRQLYLASRRFFERLAQARPLLLVFEDLHWMDDASGRLLEHLLPLVDRAPLLIVGLSRPESESAGARMSQAARQNHDERTTEIQLSPLPPAASRSLIQNLLAVDGLPAHQRKSIIGRASGNPFFLEEIIRSLIDAGAVEWDPGSGRWQATNVIDELQLPETVQGVVMARVDRLAHEAKQVLRTASVIGRSFLFRVLGAVGEPGWKLEGDLDRLQAVDFIREKQRLPELEYIFKHALAQEAVYESILLETRQRLHRRVAKTIESLFENRLEEVYELLAYHYARAESWEEALDYLLRAGDQASQVAADAEALAHYQQALAAYERAFSERWDPLQRATLERKMGQALFRRGEHEQALEHLERALSLLGRPLATSRWGVRLATLAEIAQQILLRLSTSVLRKSGGPEAYPGEVEMNMVSETLFWIDLVGKPERLLLDTLTFLNAAERIGHQVQAVNGYALLSGALAVTGRFGLSERYARLGMAQARRDNHPGSLAAALQSLATNRAWQGLAEKGIEQGLKSAQLYRETGSIRGWGTANLTAAEAMAYVSRYAETVAIAEELMEVGREGGDIQVLAWGYILRGLVERYTGDPEASIASFRRADELAIRVPDYVSRVNAVALIGHNRLRMGQIGPALEFLNQADGICREHMVGGRFLGWVRNGFAWAHVLAVETAIARGARPDFDSAVRACKAARQSARGYRLHEAEVLRLQGTCDWLRGRANAAEGWWAKSLETAGRFGQPYEVAMTYKEMGLRLEEPAYLEKAAGLLAEIGARPDLPVLK
jgi:class 3 adenylate cyclase/tetratricopeptide (TPR) repeat protein